MCYLETLINFPVLTSENFQTSHKEDFIKLCKEQNSSTSLHMKLLSLGSIILHFLVYIIFLTKPHLESEQGIKPCPHEQLTSAGLMVLSSSFKPSSLQNLHSTFFPAATDLLKYI